MTAKRAIQTRLAHFGLFTILGTMFFLTNTALASPTQEFYIQQALDRYFTLPENGQGLALGGTMLAISNDSSGLIHNPAGLGRMQTYEVSGSIGVNQREGREFLTDKEIDQTENRGYITAAFPLGMADESFPNSLPHYGTIAVSYSRYKGDTNDSINTSPDGHRRAAAYGLAVTDDISLGYGFTFYDDQLHSDLSDLHSHSRFLHTFGVQYDPSPEWTVGALFRLGIGQSDTEDYKLLSDGLSHLREYEGALSARRKWGATSALMGFDYAHARSRGNLTDSSVSPGVVIGGNEEGDVYNVRAGIEQIVTGGLILRAGARYQFVHYTFQRPDLHGLTGTFNAPACSTGIGYVLGDPNDGKLHPHVDYGFDYLFTDDGTWQHILSFSVPF